MGEIFSQHSEEEPSNKEQENNIEINPEVVKEVEQSNFFIFDKVNLLLVKRGLKPTAEMSLVLKREEPGISIQLTEEDIQQSLDVIRQLGIPCQIGEKKSERFTQEANGLQGDYYHEDINILVARSDEELQKLKTYTDNIKELDETFHKGIGKIYGYPETAVDAYATGENIDSSNLPEDVRNSDAFLFADFGLSKDHWQEELKQGKHYADFIKSVSPTLYEEKIKYSKEENAGVERIK